MIGILVPLLGAVLLGIANVFLKRALKDFSPAVNFFVFSIITFFLSIPFLIFFGFSFQTNIWLWLATLQSAFIGQLLWFIAFSLGEASVITPVISTYGIFTLLFSTLLNGEHLNTLQICFVGLTILGTVVVSIPEEKVNLKNTKSYAAIFALFTAMMIGLSDTISNRTIDTYGISSFLTHVPFAQIVLALIFLTLKKEFKNIPSWKNLKDYKFSLVASILTSISLLLLFSGFYITFASIAGPIHGSSPVITIVLAGIFLKEKINSKNRLGILLTLLGTFGLALVR